jgi:hypothetical protein
MPRKRRHHGSENPMLLPRPLPNRARRHAATKSAFFSSLPTGTSSDNPHNAKPFPKKEICFPDFTPEKSYNFGMASTSSTSALARQGGPRRGGAPAPREVNTANLQMALAVSREHGGRGVAMLVKGEDRCVAVDQSDIWAGHTALLLLLQEISAIPANPEIYYDSCGNAEPCRVSQ